MSTLATEQQRYTPPPVPDNWRERYIPMERQQAQGGVPTGLLIAGLVAVGVGVLSWYYLGPDLRRYLKIHNM